MGTFDLIIPFFFLLVPVMWWIVSSLSVRRFLASKPMVIEGKTSEPVTLFKPLPPLKDEDERAVYAASIASFAGQMLAGDEILVRCQEADGTFWKQKALEWENSCPGLRIQIFPARAGDTATCANPKINAMTVLAPHASHDLWWWSDADITVPSGEVARIRSEYGHGSAVLQTQAYVIPRIARKEDWLDAMFIHVELLPGLTLLAAKKTSGFACGGSLLFRKKDLDASVVWEELGGELADDYFLGQKMQPVHLGRSLMQTQSGEQGLVASWLHYWRWQKTVRWCHPAGFAGLLFLQPLWLALLAALVGVPLVTAFVLLLLLVGLESLWVWSLFKQLHIKSRTSVLWISPLWSILRSATWLLCWLPFSVQWSGIKWWKSKAAAVG